MTDSAHPDRPSDSVDSAAVRPRWPRGVRCDCCRERVWVIALRVKTIYGDVVRYCAACAKEVSHAH